MRIVFVIHSLERGGAERVISTMANYWASAGYEITIVTLAAEELDGYELAPTVRRVALRQVGSAESAWIKLRNYLRRVRALGRAIRQIQPDVAISFTTNVNILTVLAMLGSHIPVIISDRMDPDAIELGPVKKRLCNIAYRKASLLVVQTNSAKAIMQKRFPSLPIAVVPNPVASIDPDRRKTPVPLRSMLSVPDNTRLIAGMGRLGPEKGFDLLISAFCLLAKDFPDWQLVIFGEGRLRNDLEQQIETNGLIGRVHLPGVSDTPRAHLTECDVFVLSSRHEGFPNVLLEAMASGLPVIGFDCSYGPRDIIKHKFNGVLVENGDINKLGCAIESLIKDVRYRQFLAKNAIQVTDLLSIRSVMQLWNNLIRVNLA